ncbi:hypothetical protein [Fusobacterium sp.]|uniref:hypothetical protein n=1 Tax=Fusobacterium sp. TaxID=68766 RepID=UPI002E79AD81|nr:hypothetical protein [Fusobacterium sp.]MEE1477273.1 hypothetical protein [Fusobacterium sp.]
MKKQVFFIENSRKERDLKIFFNIVKEIESEIEKMSYNYYFNNKLMEKIILRKDEYFRARRELIRLIEEGKDIAIFFYYKSEQNYFSREVSIKENEYEELLNEIVSIFDRRKINKCFNYEVDEEKREKLADKIITSVIFFNKELKEQTLEKKIKDLIKKILVKTMEMDCLFFNKIENSYNKIKEFNRLLTSLIKLKKENENNLEERTKKVIERLTKKLKEKYMFLVQEVDPELAKKIKKIKIKNKRTFLVDIDYSKLELYFPKVTKKYILDVENEKKIKNFYEDEVEHFSNLQVLVLDETLGIMLEQEKKYLSFFLEGKFDNKFLKNIGGMYNYIIEYDLYEKYCDKIKCLVKVDFTKISNNILKNVEKNLNFSTLEGIVSFSETKEAKNENEILKLFEIILNYYKDEKNNKISESGTFNLEEEIYKRYIEKLLKLVKEICEFKIAKDKFYDEIFKLDSIRELLREEECYKKIKEFSSFYDLLCRENFFERLLEIVNQNNNKDSLLKIYSDFLNKSLNYFKNKKIKFKDIIEYIYDPVYNIDVFIERHADYEEVRLKHNIMKNYLFKYCNFITVSK